MRTPSLSSAPTRLASAALVAALALALAACGGTAPGAGDTGPGTERAATGAATTAAASGSYTFTDDTGNSVTVNNPQRVVVGMGSLADIWRDAGGSFAGVSDDAFDNFGFDRSQVQSVGDHTNLSIEKILSVDPDFVILSGNADDDSSNKGPSQAQLKQALEASGVTVAFFKVDTFDDYLRMLKTCTDITGRADLYKQNGTDVQGRVSQALSQYSVAGDGAPTVLVMNASSKGVSAQKPDHMASEMVKALGAKLLTEENPSLLKDFSMEAVAELDPDYIFVLPAAKDDATAQRNYEKAVEGNAAWQGIGAVQRGHVTVLDIEHFFRKPNAEWDVAYETLGKALKAAE